MPVYLSLSLSLPVCSTLSIFGFIIAMCVAMTVAAHGGALAGLGIALVSKPILFEVSLHVHLHILQGMVSVILVHLTMYMYSVLL